MFGRLRPKHILLGLSVYAGGVYAGIALTSKKKPDVSAEAIDECSRSHAFSSIAKKYDDEIGLSEWTSGILGFRQRILESCQGKVLEIAAGTGRNLEYYPKNTGIKGLEITITDFNEAMLSEAEKKIQKWKETKLKGKSVVTKIADAHQLPFPDATFDTVVDTFGLCSLENPETALREMKRVCKPAGKILLLEHGRSSYEWLTW
eukprot:CAMPEP_0184026192 /NCGR_PEP_ID=MMETSP0954-20121128/13349_1 /TAXON_ID=627963 /ORGANISM="Aplanochytrium sp, Strain PBS07" /LENGTH=203 /DNA_ID=CAMNT_0026310299 /DNA_START=54 /DNA_END=662 /DNA_ORIENTATION=-